jgi:hypothetical protein
MTDLSKLAYIQTPELSEIAAEVAAASTPVEAPAGPDPRENESWSFLFTFKDPSGRMFEGEFTNKILTVGERTRSGLICARLRNNTPASALDDESAALTAALAHLELSLVKRPKWAEKLDKLVSPFVVLELWNRARGHEDFYFRHGAVEENG